MLILLLSLAPLASKALTPIEIVSGSIEFTAPVNVWALNVHGNSHEVSGSFALAETPDGFVLSDVHLSVSVESLHTGMRIRDRHMRDRVFRTEDGSLPVLAFTTRESLCTRRSDAATCLMVGSLSIRGVPRELAMEITATRHRDDAYRAEGEAVIRLSDYGIERPSQFGVTVTDEVELRVVLIGQPSGIRE